jgi:hypothetical protein
MPIGVKLADISVRSAKAQIAVHLKHACSRNILPIKAYILPCCIGFALIGSHRLKTIQDIHMAVQAEVIEIPEGIGKRFLKVLFLKKFPVKVITPVLCVLLTRDVLRGNGIDAKFCKEQGFLFQIVKAIL